MTNQHDSDPSHDLKIGPPDVSVTKVPTVTPPAITPTEKHDMSSNKGEES